jgi:hypothetical protein
MSLILVLGFVLIFSLTTTAVVNELVLNQSAAGRDQKMITALAAAEAEMNFAQQWVQANDQADLKATSSIFPTSTDTPKSKLAASDKSTDATYAYITKDYYTGNAVADATTYGWWAEKHTPSECTTLSSGRLTSTNLNCWLVEGRATVGQSTREVQMILSGNVAEYTTTTIPTTTTNTTTVTNTDTVTNTSTITVQTSTTNYGSWGYGTFSSGASGGCYDMSGQASVAEPVYTPGNLCMSGQAAIVQNSAKNVTVFIKGTLTVSGQAAIGTSANHVSSATIGACNNGGVVSCKVSASSKVYADVYASSGAAINKPTLSASSVYASADPGPMHPCTVAAGSSGTLPVFDGDGVMNKSVANTNALWGSTYVCKTATGGSIAWNATSHVFTISGTVFVDGDLTLASTTNIIYQGRGNVYFYGTLNMSGQSYICPASNCPTDGSWNMATNLLLLGALNKGVVPASCGYTWSMSGQSQFQGAAYVNGCIDESGQGGVEGPAAADGYRISGQGTYYQSLGTNTLPPGAPVNQDTTSTTTQTLATTTFPSTGTFTTTVASTTTITKGYWGQFPTSWRQLL